MNVHEWVAATKAGDIMVRNVVSVWPTHTLAQVAAVVTRERISGVPVAGSDGVCVGVFSISDFLRAEAKGAGAQQQFAHSSFFTSDLALPVSVYEEQVAALRDEIAPAAEHPVSDFMTTNLVSVAEEDSLEKIVAAMVDAHIHRMLVLDDSRRLRGVITTIDVLAALRRAAQQQ